MSKTDGYPDPEKGSENNGSTPNPKPVVKDFTVSKVSIPMNIPKNFAFRESAEHPEMPDKTTIGIWIDSTGSMKEWPRYLLPMLGDFFYQLRNSRINIGLPDVCFGSVGDVCNGDLSGKNVIYMPEYETDERLNLVLKNLTIPGLGGANLGESYDLALLTSLLKTKMDCALRGKKGLLILPLDEPNTDGPLSANNIRKFIDSEYSGPDLTLEEILEKVREKFVVCVVVVETKTSKQHNVAQWWKDRLGSQYVHEIPQSLITNKEYLASIFVSIVESSYPEMIAGVNCTYAELHDIEQQKMSSLTSSIQNVSMQSQGVALSPELLEKINQTLEIVINSTHDQAFYISNKRAGQQYLLNTLLIEPTWTSTDLEILQNKLDDRYPEWCSSSNGNNAIVELFNEICEFVVSAPTQQQAFDEVDNNEEKKYDYTR